MVLSVFMLRMKNELTSLFATLMNDIEDASPNTKSKLQEIYPISFKMDLKGHKDIYVCLDDSTKNITFSKIDNVDFQIEGSISEFLEILFTKKLKKEMLTGDVELAIVMINALIKSDLDFVYLIEKYFGNAPVHNQYFTMGTQHEIRRFNISMHDAHIMSIGQCFTDPFEGSQQSMNTPVFN